jgi:hypothetical protein
MSELLHSKHNEDCHLRANEWDGAGWNGVEQDDNQD